MCLICGLFVRDNTLSIKTIQKLFLFKMCGEGGIITHFFFIYHIERMIQINDCSCLKNLITENKQRFFV